MFERFTIPLARLKLKQPERPPPISHCSTAEDRAHVRRIMGIIDLLRRRIPLMEGCLYSALFREQVRGVDPC
jgi:hypothetical protein